MRFLKRKGKPDGPGDPCVLGGPGGPGGPGDPGGQDVSLDDMHSENVWFSWSKPSNYRGKLRCHVCDRRTYKRRRKVENRAMLM